MTDPTAATDWFSRRTIAEFAGSTAIIIAITVTIRRVTGYSHVIVPLLLSLGLSFALGYHELYDALGWFVVVGNGCLLFLAVVGANEMAVERPAGAGVQHGKGPKQFFGSFFA